MVNARPPVLYLHYTAKHDGQCLPQECFPVLADFDTADPKGEKKAAADALKMKEEAAAKKKKAAGNDSGDLLSAGLTIGKKAKKKYGKK